MSPGKPDRYLICFFHLQVRLYFSVSTPELVMWHRFGTAMRVLIVDDGLGTPAIAASLLLADGHVVRVEQGAFSAIGAGINFKPHVVLVDVKLPVSRAYAVARTIRTEHPASKVVAVVEAARCDIPAIFDFVLIKWFDYAVLHKWILQNMSP